MDYYNNDYGDNYEVINEKLDIYDSDKDNLLTRQPLQDISKKSDSIFGSLGYGKNMQRVLINNELKTNLSKGIGSNTLTDENIENIENIIRTRGKESEKASGMDDTKAMRVLISKAKAASTLRTGGRRKRKTKKQIKSRRQRRITPTSRRNRRSVRQRRTRTSHR